MSERKFHVGDTAYLRVQKSVGGKTRPYSHKYRVTAVCTEHSADGSALRMCAIVPEGENMIIYNVPESDIVKWVDEEFLE